MQIYLVGGAVRDGLLGLPVTDRDWVVVGATPEQMVALGYRPVGRDFPVFLHPQTHEEYALARTERKTAPGYRGFAIHSAPDVTLEQDLARRDLTINAMAVAASDVDRIGAFDRSGATVIDPWNGRSDLRQKVLRHVTDAFREDPVRVLRVARFAARFADFRVAPETLELMQQMVAHGETQALVAERVWQEIARGLMEVRPSRLCETMRQSNAWHVVLPELAPVPASAGWPHLLQMLDHASEAGAALPVRFACLCLPATQPLAADAVSKADLEAFGKRLRVPTDCQALALLVARELPALQASLALDAAGTVALLERCDAWRKPERFGQALQVLALYSLGAEAESAATCARLAAALRAAQSVSTDSVAQAAQADGVGGAQVGERIRTARIAAVAAAT